jgi:hypothetical protein
MAKHRIYFVTVASVYSHYIAKAEKKGRTKAEVDEIICWLTGYSQEKLNDQLIGVLVCGFITLHPSDR